MIHPKHIIGPLYTESRFKDVKDPCIVHDGIHWHIYGSGGDVRSEVWVILHATAPSITGPWTEREPCELRGVCGDHVAAPSVYYDPSDSAFHMIVQTEFTSIGGTIEYLRSVDGHVFEHVNTALHSVPDSSEAGIYDAHQVLVGETKYIVYAGTPAIEGFNNQYIIQPDVHLAYSDSADSSWIGPWVREGIILDHDHIDWHHNPRSHKEYEWGIEGPQILQLPNGTFFLNATCFLANGRFGTRQRVFFAVSKTIAGPYTSLGPIIDPALYQEHEWLSGENGHATAIIQGNELYLFFQARSSAAHHAVDNNWRYGIAVFDIDELLGIDLDSL